MNIQKRWTGNIEIELLEQYAITKEKTDKLSLLKCMNSKIITKMIENNGFNTIEELSEYITESFVTFF